MGTTNRNPRQNKEGLKKEDAKEWFIRGFENAETSHRNFPNRAAWERRARSAYNYEWVHDYRKKEIALENNNGEENEETALIDYTIGKEWYLIGFNSSITTEIQPGGLEHNMNDAYILFEFIWIYELKQEKKAGNGATENKKK